MKSFLHWITTNLVTPTLEAFGTLCNVADMLKMDLPSIKLMERGATDIVDDTINYRSEVELHERQLHGNLRHEVMVSMIQCP
jgi:hypothetical protein